MICFALLLFSGRSFQAGAAEANPAAPRITIGLGTNGQPRLVFPYPAAQQYHIFSSDQVTNSLQPDTASGQKPCSRQNW